MFCQYIVLGDNNFLTNKNMFVIRYSLCMRVTEVEGVSVCEETWAVPQYRVVYGAFTNIAQV